MSQLDATLLKDNTVTISDGTTFQVTSLADASQQLHERGYQRVVGWLNGPDGVLVASVIKTEAEPAA